MNEIKRRKKGFLALLLCVVMILGIPGVDVEASSIHSGSISVNDILNSGDQIYASGNLQINYPDNTTTSVPYYSYHNVKAGGPYKVTGITVLADVVITLAYVNPPVIVAPVINNKTDFDALYNEELEKLANRIRKPGGEIHLFGGAGTESLPFFILKTLAENPDDVLVFTSHYNGYKYTYTIQGGAYLNDLISPEITWYGPMWLYSKFFLTTVVEAD